jgi:hypothetical protein
MKQPLRKLVELRLAIESLNSLVQIIAIVAAGVWAFYTFIYEDNIKPAAGIPTISMQNTLEKVGTKGNLVVIKFVSKIRNTGKTRERFLAYSLHIKGFKVQRNAQGISNFPKILDQVKKRGSAEEDRYFAPTKPEILYRSVRLLKGTANPHSGTLYLDPGDESSVEHLFLVDTKRFDEINAFIDYKWTKNQSKEFPMVVKEETTRDPAHRGSLYMEEVNPPSSCSFDSFECSLESDGNVSLALWP